MESQQTRSQVPLGVIRSSMQEEFAAGGKLPFALWVASNMSGRSVFDEYAEWRSKSLKDIEYAPSEPRAGPPLPCEPLVRR